MSDYHIKRAVEIIKNIKYVTIATASKDLQPWNSPVYSAFDHDLNFYWFSDKNSQHSTNIRDNKEVFLVIYDSTAPEGTGEGVYLQARAVELEDETETMSALQVMDDRVGKNKDRNYQDYSGEAVLRGYKATPYKIWMNGDELDENNQYVRDIRIEIPIQALQLSIR
jgi:nitroimidazol reductase NimA-like FMN-containing flavoprotein (pyridoxamine 5'-phosphate oxidase superfamily)